MYFYEIFTIYGWNIYVFNTYNFFLNFLLQWINSQLKKQKCTFGPGQKLRNVSILHKNSFNDVLQWTINQN